LQDFDNVGGVHGFAFGNIVIVHISLGVKKMP
jgi:hypothetical protein